MRHIIHSAALGALLLASAARASQVPCHYETVYVWPDGGWTTTRQPLDPPQPPSSLSDGGPDDGGFAGDGGDMGDAGDSNDAGSATDAGPAVDAGAQWPLIDYRCVRPPQYYNGTGCGCSGGPSAPFAFAGFALLLAALRRR